MKLFFIYKGDLEIDVYVSRLSQLGNPKIIAAFPTRPEAIAWALNQDNGLSTVVVERGLSLQVGDDNNLISELEWNAVKEPEKDEPIENITGIVKVVGLAEVGSEITANIDEISGAGQPIFQWSRGSDNKAFAHVEGANKFSYLLTNDDIGKYFLVKVERCGYDGVVYSKSIGPVQAPALPALAGIVEIDGNIQVGETLSADTSQVNSTDLNYQWFRTENLDQGHDPINGATQSTYVLAEDDEDKYIMLGVSSSTHSGELFSERIGPVVG